MPEITVNFPLESNFLIVPSNTLSKLGGVYETFFNGHLELNAENQEITGCTRETFETLLNLSADKEKVTTANAYDLYQVTDCYGFDQVMSKIITQVEGWETNNLETFLNAEKSNSMFHEALKIKASKMTVSELCQLVHNSSGNSKDTYEVCLSEKLSGFFNSKELWKQLKALFEQETDIATILQFNQIPKQDRHTFFYSVYKAFEKHIRSQLGRAKTGPEIIQMVLEFEELAKKIGDIAEQDESTQDLAKKFKNLINKTKFAIPFYSFTTLRNDYLEITTQTTLSQYKLTCAEIMIARSNRIKMYAIYFFTAGVTACLLPHTALVAISFTACWMVIWPVAALTGAGLMSLAVAVKSAAWIPLQYVPTPSDMRMAQVLLGILGTMVASASFVVSLKLEDRGIASFILRKYSHSPESIVQRVQDEWLGDAPPKSNGIPLMPLE